MIVELVGLPGAGKTTYAKELIREGFVRVDAGTKGEILVLNILFALRFPLTFFRTLVFLLRHLGPRFRWKLKVANLFFVHNTKYMKACSLSRAVIDQGHFQNIMSLFDEPQPRDVILRYVALFPRPDKIVLFDISPKVRAERLSGRTRGVRRHESSPLRESWIAAAEENFSTLRSLLVAEGPFSVPIHVATHDSLPLPADLARPVWHVVMNARMPTEKAHGLQIAKSCEALRRNGVDVALWIPTRKGSAPDRIASTYGITDMFAVRRFRTPTCSWVPFALPRYVLQTKAFLLALMVARIDPEGVYFSRSRTVVFLMKIKGARTVIYEAHGFPRLFSTWGTLLLRGVDLIVANSGGTRGEYAKRLSVPVLVLPNSVDRAAFEIIRDSALLRRTLNIPAESRIVMYLGSFYAWKGVPFLVDTWRKNFADRKDVVLVLVGGTKDDLVKESNGDKSFSVPANIRLVPHLGDHEKVPEYLALADILVLPTVPISKEATTYTSPIKLFEYMAAGKAIVASRLPSICEIVSDADVAFFCPNDATDLAGAIDRLLQDKMLREEMGRRARRALAGKDWTARARLLLARVHNIAVK